MSVDDAVAELHRFAGALQRASEAPVAALARLEARMDDRIFRQGRAADGSAIGVYSTQPIYVQESEMANRSAFKAGGKAGTGKGKGTGMYVPGGYRQLREMQSLQTRFVDLDYTGGLRASFTVGRGTGRAAEIRFATAEGAALAAKNERHFNKVIFSPSAAELAALDAEIAGRIRQVFKEEGF